MTSFRTSNLTKELSILFVIILFGLFDITLVLSQEVITTSGESRSNSSVSISYTIGELVIDNFSGTNNILTQGFQQSNIIVTSINETKQQNIEITAYPNPMHDFITLRIDKENMTGMQYQLYDLDGKLLEQNILVNEENAISFEHLSPASYILKILYNKTNLKSFLIIKSK